jgi:hypothetical protein
VTRFIHLEIIFSRVPVSGETPQAQQLCLRKAAMNKRLSNEHISHMDISTSKAVDEATKELSLVKSRSLTLIKHAQIKDAKRILEFREQKENEWKPELEHIKTNSTAKDGAPVRVTYATMAQDCQHSFWEDVWSKDVAAAMLSGVKMSFASLRGGGAGKTVNRDVSHGLLTSPDRKRSPVP